MVYTELLDVYRSTPRALRWQRVPAASRHLRPGGRTPRPAIHDLLSDPAGGRCVAYAAVQARLGSRRFGIRWPAPAVREVLCRRAVYRARSRLSRDPVGGVPPDRR